MKLSARNMLKGTIVEVKKGQTTSHVRIDIGGGNVVTASITTSRSTTPACRRARPPMR